MSKKYFLLLVPVIHEYFCVLNFNTVGCIFQYFLSNQYKVFEKYFATLFSSLRLNMLFLRLFKQQSSSYSVLVFCCLLPLHTNEKQQIKDQVISPLGYYHRVKLGANEITRIQQVHDDHHPPPITKSVKNNECVRHVPQIKI